MRGVPAVGPRRTEDDPALRPALHHGRRGRQGGTLRAVALLLLALGASAGATAQPCEAKHPISPQQLVDKADLIVVATANGYFRPPVLGRAGRGGLLPPANSGDEALPAVAFTVDEVIKGSWGGTGAFNLPGKLDDEKAEGEPDASIPRHKARGNACIATTYVSGGKYLLLFQRAPEGLVIDWAPLSPANERIRGERDPWLEWVRARAATAQRMESH